MSGITNSDVGGPPEALSSGTSTGVRRSSSPDRSPPTPGRTRRVRWRSSEALTRPSVGRRPGADPSVCTDESVRRPSGSGHVTDRHPHRDRRPGAITSAAQRRDRSTIDPRHLTSHHVTPTHRSKRSRVGSRRCTLARHRERHWPRKPERHDPEQHGKHRHHERCHRTGVTGQRR